MDKQELYDNLFDFIISSIALNKSFENDFELLDLFQMNSEDRMIMNDIQEEFTSFDDMLNSYESCFYNNRNKYNLIDVYEQDINVQYLYYESLIVNGNTNIEKSISFIKLINVILTSYDNIVNDVGQEFFYKLFSDQEPKKIRYYLNRAKCCATIYCKIKDNDTCNLEKKYIDLIKPFIQVSDDDIENKNLTFSCVGYNMNGMFLIENMFNKQNNIDALRKINFCNDVFLICFANGIINKRFINAVQQHLNDDGISVASVEEDRKEFILYFMTKDNLYCVDCNDILNLTK